MTAEAKWGCTFDDERNVHVEPLDDITEHDLTEDCVCGPWVEHVDNPTGDRYLITHHSLDGREANE